MTISTAKSQLYQLLETIGWQSWNSYRWHSTPHHSQEGDDEAG